MEKKCIMNPRLNDGSKNRRKSLPFCIQGGLTQSSVVELKKNNVNRRSVRIVGMIFGEIAINTYLTGSSRRRRWKRSVS